MVINKELIIKLKELRSKRYGNNSMNLSNNDLIDYAKDFYKSYKRLPKIISYQVGMIVTNAEDTSDLRPWESWRIGNSWKNYWRAFANGNVLLPVGEPKCCSNKSSSRPSSFFHILKREEDIVGAHVEVVIGGKKEEHLYIIPLCKACNQIDSEIKLNILPDTIMVEVIGDYKVKENNK